MTKTCPSNHWNNGDDVCADCGVSLNAGAPVETAPAPVVPTGYEELALVLRWALEHASAGKGAQRHSTGEPFIQQPILTITRRYGLGFALGQAEKKMQESARMKPLPAKHELLGAINYIAAAVIRLEEIEREIHPPL